MVPILAMIAQCLPKEISRSDEKTIDQLWKGAPQLYNSLSQK